MAGPRLAVAHGFKILVLTLLVTLSVAVTPASSATFDRSAYDYNPSVRSSPGHPAASQLRRHAPLYALDTSGDRRGPTSAAVVASVVVRDLGVAAKSADEFVDLASASRRSHILDGHRYGGEAGNTWFPRGWSDDKIMNSISDIATDPSLTWVQQTGRAGAAFTRGGAPVRYTVEGVSDGVKMRVVLEPGGEGIITGFPIP